MVTSSVRNLAQLYQALLCLFQAKDSKQELDLLSVYKVYYMELLSKFLGTDNRNYGEEF